VAAWFIVSRISASGGLVYTQRNICQWRLGLYTTEYLPVAAWFIHSIISDNGGFVYT